MIKLFRLNLYENIHPEYGTYSAQEPLYFISQDFDTVREYINRKLGIDLDATGTYVRFHKLEEKLYDSYILEEIDVTIVPKPICEVLKNKL